MLYELVISMCFCTCKDTPLVWKVCQNNCFKNM